MKAQTLHFAFRLTRSEFFFPSSFFKLLQITSSNLKQASVRQVLELQGSVLTPAVPMQSQRLLHTVHCKKKGLTSTSVHLHKVSTGISCATQLTGRLSAFSAAHRKHSWPKHQPDTCKGAWVWRSPGLGDLKQLIALIFSVLALPILHTCVNTIVCMINQTKQLKVPNLYKGK